MQRISPAVRRTDQDTAHMLFDNRNPVVSVPAAPAAPVICPAFLSGIKHSVHSFTLTLNNCPKCPECPPGGNASYQTDTFCTLVYTHPQRLSKLSRMSPPAETSVIRPTHSVHSFKLTLNDCPECQGKMTKK